MHAKLVTWLGLAFSIALVVFIASHFDLLAAMDAIRLSHPGWLAAATLAYCAQFPLRGLRWSVLMRAVKPVSWRTATEVFTIGFMANNVLPARLGDVARAFVLAKRENVPASATFSNVMLERVFDGLTVVGFLSLVLWLDPPSAQWVGTVAALMALLFLGAVLVAAAVASFEDRVLALAKFCTAWLPEKYSARLLNLISRLAKGLHTLKSAKETAVVVLLSIVIWSAEVVVYVLAQRAFGMQIPPLGLALVMAILTLGLTAPSAPGFVGVYEGLIIAGVGVYGVGEPLAPAFAIAMHLIHYVPGTLFGLGCSWWSGLKLRELRSASTELEHTAEDHSALKTAEMELG
jgi:glycosyltransferase 2 family protein